MNTRTVWGFIALLFQLPIVIYGGWLLYNHIHATELMWFVWWLNVPMVVIGVVIGQFAKK